MGAGFLNAQTLGPVVGQVARTRTAGTLAAGELIPANGLAMAVDGVAYKARSSTGLAGVLVARGSKIDGADANGQVIFCSHGRRCRVQFQGGQSKTLGLDSITIGAGTSLDILIQLGTDGSSVVTTTALAFVNWAIGNAQLKAYGLRWAWGGNGSGLCAASGSMTSAAVVSLLGWATQAYDNSGGGSDATLEMLFAVGSTIMAVSSSSVTRATVPGIARATNETTVSGYFASDLDLPIRVTDVNASGKALVEV